MTVRVLVGDCRDVLKTLPDASVQCCVTSPPYWGLRDYGTAKWEGGDAACDHRPEVKPRSSRPLGSFHGSSDTESSSRDAIYREACGKCGAVRIDSQIGLERTPDEYVAQMVAVFRDVRRVLRDDGTLWLNLGDSYATGEIGRHDGGSTYGDDYDRKDFGARRQAKRPANIKPKDLVGIPWRVAFALQADGWYLRSDIIWHKLNPMPESVTDRPTKAHEYLFLFAKGQRKTRVIAFSDLSREPFHLGKYIGRERPDLGAIESCVLLATALFDSAQREDGFCLPPFYAEEWKQGDDNCDSDFVRGLPAQHGAAVWSARFLNGNTPAEQFLREVDRFVVTLSERDDLLVSGIDPFDSLTPAVYRDGERSVTVHHAGKVSKIEFAHDRIIASSATTCYYYYDADAIAEPANGGDKNAGTRNYRPGTEGNQRKHEGQSVVDIRATRNSRSVWTVATQPYSGAHFATFPSKLIEPCILAGCPKGGTVLDPFGGAGTTGLVADRLGRDAILIELNPAYAALGSNRITDDSPLFADVNVDGAA